MTFERKAESSKVRGTQAESINDFDDWRRF
jgi:hypothetical protein